jgi:hypothetical protein
MQYSKLCLLRKKAAGMTKTSLAEPQQGVRRCPGNRCGERAGAWGCTQQLLSAPAPPLGVWGKGDTLLVGAPCRCSYFEAVGYIAVASSELRTGRICCIAGRLLRRSLMRRSLVSCVCV